MGISFGALGGLALKIAGVIVPAVRAIEAIAAAIATLRGQGKQDAAVDLVKGMIEALELGAGRDVLDDAEVEAALRAAIDAIVHLQNVVATKQAGAGV